MYVTRSDVPETQVSSADSVHSYKGLSAVERAFRSLKTVDLHVRPIYHHLDPRVCSHIFLCMLAYYVEWHMREAWRELTFVDQDLQAKRERDSVAPANRSRKALQKSRLGYPRGRLCGAQLPHAAAPDEGHRAQNLPDSRRQGSGELRSGHRADPAQRRAQELVHRIGV